ncbi:hypothetical protein Ab1vBOLIVR2_gp84c [Agrobacterium phage OLIVR2]|uniref:Uncharacterized protein n=1 Tax=Agrobacterium phage OLIVR1 TaxID=2723769 RepID=A0A858MU51_9CAUD|nr:hypothetical protein KNU98_gp024 [Agrobacterium phage OLIVR1]QIW87280.1 hypothetical protein Ab1vBOLIVR1_gp85c [Agrobacterium phage OLIVR1]QIW87387.1 hypothetical protein Ab1vBOLIVR2_gp84c [Agrobacterium phage OLIVR2]QIW87494.1 hypothetical protein Ab1vBOLIVR3_gp84c [Agrobacterium phage OLIVR3]
MHYLNNKKATIKVAFLFWGWVVTYWYLPIQ